MNIPTEIKEAILAAIKDPKTDEDLKKYLENIVENYPYSPAIRIAMVRAKIEGEDELRKVLESQLLPLSIEEERRRREVENKKQYEIYQKEKEREEQLERDRIEEEQLEEEQLERDRIEEEQLEEEQLERDRIEKAAYRYLDVFHMCPIKNLSYIIEKGLFSRVLTPPGFKDIAKKAINRRREKMGLARFASTYFEPINGMYYDVRNESEIVIVEFSIDLSKSGIEITDGNAVVPRTTKTNFYSSNFVEIMESLKKIIANPYRGQAELEDDGKYSERKRRFQAECLVPEKISRDCIKSIHLAGKYRVSSDYGNTVTYVDNLIANSGLSIKRKIMNHSPPRIIRE